MTEDLILKLDGDEDDGVLEGEEGGKEEKKPEEGDEGIEEETEEEEGI